MSLDDAEYRANEARMIIGHDLFKEGFAHTREALIRAIEDADATDTIVMEKLSIALQVLKSVKAHLESCIEDETVSKIKPEEY